MANPIKAVKAVTRAVAGITGKGGKSVNPLYNEPIKINSNPNKTPAKSMNGATDSSIRGRGPQEYDWQHNDWNSKEGVDDYGNPTYNSKAPVKPIKVNSNRRGR
jgi:hypothetical protein